MYGASIAPTRAIMDETPTPMFLTYQGNKTGNKVNARKRNLTLHFAKCCLYPHAKNKSVITEVKKPHYNAPLPHL